MIHLSGKNRKIDAVIELTRSKSESNRALVLGALFPGGIRIMHLSDSDDTKVLAEALQHYQDRLEINVGHAGTSYRFLTAFLAIQKKGEWILTGSDRMKERPVKILVDGLCAMGADISYLEKEGYPPLKINGGQKLTNQVVMDAGVSSQYISALMMIGAKIEGGLKIELEGKVTSLPYLKMTASMMHDVGIKVKLGSNSIEVEEAGNIVNHALEIEGDWSAASYWFSAVALGELGSSIRIRGLNKVSRQGDAMIMDYYAQLGVGSEYVNGDWILTRKRRPTIETLQLDLSGTPDVAQTLVCTCAGLGIGVAFSGLHTLRIKETDRLTALKNELEKFDIKIQIPNDDELFMRSGQRLKTPSGPIATYKDHRMAMAFAPLALYVDLSIENENVVSKSYPDFWKDFENLLMQDFKN